MTQNIIERGVPNTKEWKFVYPELLKRYRFALPYIKDKNVLDAACGSGYFSNFLLKHGAYGVTGIDIDKKTIENAKNTYGDKNLKFTNLPIELVSELDEKFDTIVSMETIEHVQDATKVLEEIAKVLKREGVLIISTPNKAYSVEKNIKNPYHVKEFYLDDFKELLQKFFYIEKAAGFVPDNVKFNEKVHPVNYIFTNYVPRVIKNLIPFNLKMSLYYRLNKDIKIEVGDYKNCETQEELVKASCFIFICRNNL